MARHARRAAAATLLAAMPAAAPAQSLSQSPALTIYNQGFAVSRQNVELNLKQGLNTVSFSDTTAHLEPSSVILRDPSGRVNLRILEQNFRADPVSQALLLSLHEGKTIDFRVVRGDIEQIVRGKIIRSGYVPHSAAFQRYGQQYAMRQHQMAYGDMGGGGQPIIEVDGKIRFNLPGEPLFPSLGDDSILKPTLDWTIDADVPGKTNAELGYVTGGMMWEADYNVIAPESGTDVDILGWVTIDNQSGKSFENARIKLMAGDVNKFVTPQMYLGMARNEAAVAGGRPPEITSKAFDEYHLYTLERPTTLRDRQTKQVEFVRAEGVKNRTLYVYEGAWIDPQRYGYWNPEQIRQDKSYGTEVQPKVWVMREFKNDEASGLGMPLPKGRLRFYRQDADGQLEFTGENIIDHTPKNETVRVYTGDAFDLRGERKQTNFQSDYDRRWLDESFEIKLRNHKTVPVEVIVVERLYRWNNWEIRDASVPYTKKDSRTIEFRVTIPPDGEEVITYGVHYSW